MLSRSIKFRSFERWFLCQRQVLLAVILQDMKTRFGGSYLSYLIAIGWPFTHIAAISLGYMVVNHYAPVGDDPLVFVGTAIIPYMICLYPSRLIATAVLINRPFLSYSRVTPQHLILARVILEFLNISVVLLLIFLICFVVDKNVIPLSISEATAALGASVFLGIAFGFFGAILTAVIGQFFSAFITISLILLYIGSFAYVPEYMISSRLMEYLSYNPVFCLIRWFRGSYYTSYALDGSDATYVIFVALLFLLLGFAGERLLRGKIMGG